MANKNAQKAVKKASKSMSAKGVPDRARTQKPAVGRKTSAPPVEIYVSIVMGSDSDFSHMREAGLALKEMGVPFEMMVISAHRTPDEMVMFAKTAHERGIRVIIAGAGGAAHLPGMIAASSPLPVIGVPIPSTVMNGVDALYSVVQMPKGVPVATVAIGNAFNAGILAVQMLAFGGHEPIQELGERLIAYKEYLRETVLKKQLPEI